MVPHPGDKAPFSVMGLRWVPDLPGCYVLLAASGEVLYIGLATRLRRRIRQHVGTPTKRELTALGRPVEVRWLVIPNQHALGAHERGWINAYRAKHGVLPPLNKIDSPLGL